MLFHNVVEQAIAEYRKEYNDHSPMPGWARLRANRQTRSAFDDGTGFVTFDHATKKAVSVSITEEILKKGFEVGFKHVKNLVKAQLEKLAGIKSSWTTPADQQIVTTIASGGSSLHPDFHEWLVEICRELGLPEPYFTLNMEHEYG